MAQIEITFVLGAPRITCGIGGAGDVFLFLHGIGGDRTNRRDQYRRFQKGFRPLPGTRAVTVILMIMTGLWILEILRSTLYACLFNLTHRGHISSAY